MSRRERGQSLIEIAIAVAVASIAIGAAAAGTISAGRHFGANPQRTALEDAAHREMRVAVDLLKYAGGSIAPTVVATTVPLPGGSPLPAHLGVSTTALSGGGTGITITASSDADANLAASVSVTVPAPVPVPSAEIVAPGAAPAPTGAP